MKALTLITLLLFPFAVHADDPSARTQQLIDKGLSFLQSKQDPDGGWGGAKNQPAFTAIILKAFAQEYSSTEYHTAPLHELYQ